MRHFYLVANKEKKNVDYDTALICRYLEGRGCVCAVKETVKKSSPAKYKYTNPADVPGDTECVIVLGGDGTLLQAARDLSGMDIPMIGVNLGTLGYLAQIGREEDILPALRELVEDHYELESRMMLSGRVNHSDGRVSEDMALNDIVITRLDGIHSLKFNLYVNGEILNDYKADGMIISTPTGSTAYNLSAGGPIAVPASSMIIMTPICPHTLNSRSIVLPPDYRVTIELARTQGRLEQAVVFDGDTVISVGEGDTITVERSVIKTRMVRINHVSFLDNLKGKMTQI